MIIQPKGPIEHAVAPRSDWTEMGASEHFVQFYEADAFLVRALGGFVGAGLGTGDGCIVIATASHREALDAQLQADGWDIHAAIASGQYVPVDAASLLATFMVDGMPDTRLSSALVGGIIEQAARGRHGVRIFGEMVGLLLAEGNHAAMLALEGIWNALQKTHHFSLFCGYPMSGFGAEDLAPALRQVCSQHSRVIPAESYAALAGADERLREITELQQKAAALEAEVAQRKRTEEQLSQALRLRDEFLSSVSHDLKTPLTVLLGHSQLLQRRMARGDFDQGTVLEGFQLIESKTRKMTKLVEELLDVTRLRVGADLPLVRRPVDLVALARATIAEQQATTDLHQLSFQTSALRIVGRWDALRLERMVDNLIENAIKYSPQGGVIEVILEQEPGPECAVAVLTVRDRGIGVEAFDLPRIFERFYRGGNVNGLTAGAGLGLSGVQQIVVQHGGTVTIESRAGIGSTFTVRLPIA